MDFLEPERAHVVEFVVRRRQHLLYRGARCRHQGGRSEFRPDQKQILFTGGRRHVA